MGQGECDAAWQNFLDALASDQASGLEAATRAVLAHGVTSEADKTERPIQRPKAPAVKETFYSGKKKRHTVKNNVLVNDHSANVYFLDYDKSCTR